MEKAEVKKLIRFTIQDTMKAFMEFLEQDTIIVDKTTKEIIPNSELELTRDFSPKLKERIYSKLAEHGIVFSGYEADADTPYSGKTLKQHLSNEGSCCCDTPLVCSIHDKYISEQG